MTYSLPSVYMTSVTKYKYSYEYKSERLLLGLGVA